MCSQGLCKALQELRAEMVATAERNVIANAAQREESFNVQILVDKQTKELKAGFPNHHHSCVHEEPDILLIIYIFIFPSIRKDSLNSCSFLFTPSNVIDEIYQLNPCLNDIFCKPALFLTVILYLFILNCC